MSEKISENELLLGEAVMKLAAMERLLIKNNIINQQDLINEMKVISNEVIASIKSKLEKQNN